MMAIARKEFADSSGFDLPLLRPVVPLVLIDDVATQEMRVIIAIQQRWVRIVQANLLSNGASLVKSAAGDGVDRLADATLDDNLRSLIIRIWNGYGRN